MSCHRRRIVKVIAVNLPYENKSDDFLFYVGVNYNNHIFLISESRQQGCLLIIKRDSYVT